MRAFDFKKEYNSLLTPDVVALLTAIHEYRGEQALFIEAKSNMLAKFLDVVRIQSTEASNRIEGIVTTSDRLRMIVLDKTAPKTRSEKEIAGYRDVLNTIHENYEYIPPRPPMILQLHRELFKFSGSSIGGSFKNADNCITETLPDGSARVRFQPVPAWETPDTVDRLCQAFELALSDTEMDPLLLIPVFVLDFLCIHPFNDGNGRMSRLLTLLLLYRAGYIVGKYISLEKLTADTKDTYYDVLQESSTNWHKESNDYAPFVRYMLGIIVAAYREFSGRVQLMTVNGLSKPERIREMARTHVGKITKADILERFPDISPITVERTLADLLEKGKISKIGGGRYTAYVWSGEEK
ncbi:MAG: Fic family protein [Oscillospiraceae bacterium]|nr:Fic family protein [Oscillospiraceae bacterium]